MFTDKTYSLKNTTSPLYTSPTPEEHEAMVSIMRNFAKCCGITVLTYGIRLGNLSMLVRIPPHEVLLPNFRDSEGEAPGSGDRRLLVHLQQHYSEAHLQKLTVNLAALRKSGKGTTQLLEPYTNLIGNPTKFAEGINEAFGRWIKKNRPKTYTDLNGEVYMLAVSVTNVRDDEKLRMLAAGIDQHAVSKDNGGSPRAYWCGYADALRGSMAALAGLQELMGVSSADLNNIQDLGYYEWLEQINNFVDLTKELPLTKKVVAEAIQPLKKTASKQQDSSLSPEEVPRKQETAPSVAPIEPITQVSVSAPLATLPDKPLIEPVHEHEPIKEAAPANPPHEEVRQAQEGTAPVTSPIPSHSSGYLLKLALAFVLLISIGVGAVIFVKNRRAKQTTTKNPAIPHATLDEAEQATHAVPQPKARAGDLEKQNQLVDATALLQGPEATKLANAFAVASDVEARLKMCIQPESIRSRLSTYPAQALNTPAKNVIAGGVANASGMVFARFIAQFDDGNPRLLCVLSTPDGLKVDWDCFARYGTATWPQLTTGIIQSAEIRVLAKKSDYYNFTYRDEEQWICCELTSPDFEGTLYGYARRGSTTAKLIEQNFPTQTSQRMIMRISTSGGSHKHKQFSVDKVLAFGWVRGEKDLEDVWIPSALMEAKKKKAKIPELLPPGQ